MPNADGQFDLPAPAANDGDLIPAEPLHLRVTFDLTAGGIGFEWLTDGDQQVAARGRLIPSSTGFFQFWALDWVMENQTVPGRNGCSPHSASIRALLNRIRKLLPLADEVPRLGLLPDTPLGPARAGEFFPLLTPPGEDFWKRLGRDVLEFARVLGSKLSVSGDPAARGSAALRLMACARMGVQPNFDDLLDKGASLAPVGALLHLRATFDQVKGFAEFVWNSPQDRRIVATGRVRVTGGDQLTWELETDGKREPSVTSHHRNSIRARLGLWLKRFPTNRDSFSAFWVKPQPGSKGPLCQQEPPFGPHESPYGWIEDNIAAMAEALRYQFSPLSRMTQEMDPLGITEFERYQRRLLRKEQKRAEEEARRQETIARLAAERRRREQREAEARKAAQTKRAAEAKASLKSPTDPRVTAR